MTDVFLSYARKDDEPFVKQLYHGLKDKGFDVWWDRKRMPSRGLPFLREIRSAIANHERLILVVGPNALKSKVVAVELQNALRECRIVIPVLRIGDPSQLSKELPEEIVDLHCMDFREVRPFAEAMEELVRILHTEAKPLGRFYRVPSLPAHYMPRPDAIERLTKSVLAEDYQPIIITSTRQTVALQGMGGVGKSVLAAAFARTCTARRGFSDGLIWLTFGQQAEAIDNMRQVGRAFDDGEQYYLDAARAEARLPELLKAKDCLLVLDDIWDVRQAEGFINALAATPCRLLITTRDGELVNALDAQPHRVDVLTKAEALDLLASWSGVAVNDLPPEAYEVAEECGHLPFALALCGAMVKDGNLWADLRDKLREADLTFIEKELANYPFPDVLKSLKVSVDALDHEDQKREKPVGAQRRYLELAVFPPDTYVPEAAVLTLWSHTSDMDKPGARKLITRLEGKALLRTEGQSPRRRLSLHDLQHDYMRAVLGEELRELHGKLLDAYREKSKGGWHNGPNDGYFFQHLVYQLIEAGRGEEVHDLLAAETAEGRNAWYEAKESNTDLARYIADVKRAWRLAEDAYLKTDDARQKARIVGLQTRYALINSSVNSLAQNIPTAMLTVLAKKGVWPIQRCMAYARQIPDVEQHAEAMIGLLLLVDDTERENWFQETVKTVKQVAYERSRISLLLKLVAQIPDPKPEQMMSALLDEIKDFRNGDEQAYLLSEIAPSFNSSLAAEAISIAHDAFQKAPTGKSISETFDRVRTKRVQMKALIELAHRLPEEKRQELIEETLWSARGYGINFIYAETLGALAGERWSQNYEWYLREALAAAKEEDNREHDYVTSMVALLPLLRLEEQDELLPETLLAIENSKIGSDFTINNIYNLALKMNQEMREKIVAFVQQLKSETERASGLAKMAHLFEGEKREELLRQVLAEMSDSKDSIWIEETLQEIAAYLSPPLRQQALDAILALEYEDDYRVKALASLVPAFAEDDPEREALLRKGLEWVGVIKDRWRIKDALGYLAPFLSGALLKEASALAKAQTILDDDRRIYGLDVFIPLLPQREKVEAFKIVLDTVRKWESWTIATSLKEMAHDLPPESMREALAIAYGINDPLYKAWALAGLAPALASPEREKALDEAKAAIAAIEHHQHQAQVLAMIVEALPPHERGPLLEKALSIVNLIEDANIYAQELVKFTPFMAEAERDKLLEEAVEKVKYAKHREGALQALAPQLPEALARKTFKWSEWYVGDSFDRGEIIPALGLRLAEFGEHDKVYRQFTKLERNKAKALAGLMRLLPLSMLDKAAEDAHSMERGETEEVLAALSVRYAELGERQKALKIAGQIIDSRKKAEAFTEIASYLEGAELGAAMDEAVQALLKVDIGSVRFTMLKQFAAHLAKCGEAQLFSAYGALLSYLGIRIRYQMVPNLYMLSPVLVALGGTVALTETWQAIRDIYRWWP